MIQEHIRPLPVLALLFVAIGPPGWRAWRVAARLLLSRRVIVREYRTADLSPDEQLAEKGLSRIEIISLALVFGMPQGWPIPTRCLFDPHHDIQMTSASGRVSTAVICFGCDMMQFFSQPATDSSVSYFGRLFDMLLRRWFQWIGMPVRTGGYR